MESSVNIQSQSGRKTKSLSVYQRLTVAALSQLTRGHLVVRFPDGSTYEFGNGSTDFTASIQINHSDFFKKCVLYGDVGFGESYVDGDWETDSITKVISFMIYNLDNHPTISGSRKKKFNLLEYANKLVHWLRANTISGSKKNITEHYDLSNDFFKSFLDKNMLYSSGIYPTNETSLDESQIHKMDALCKRLKLKPTDHVLEIGSGWGGFSVYAVKNYGCKVTTLTISEEQFKYAKERFEREGVSDKIEIKLIDYRLHHGQYDKIVTCEMLEAVGHKFLPVFFAKCNEWLKPNGIMAHQVITCPDSRYDQLRNGVDWIQKHIFPGSLLPSVGAMNSAIAKTSDMYMHELHDMGLDYAKTLHIWRQNFNSKLNDVRSLGFNEKFIRKWNYYLSYCEAAFQMRNISVVQIVYTRPNNLNV
jgi:cyclopropane-fatty-acyl-phospholipid synthase